MGMPMAMRPCSDPSSPFSSSDLTAKTVLEETEGERDERSRSEGERAKQRSADGGEGDQRQGENAGGDGCVQRRPGPDLGSQ